jgi:hypothetical protein
MRLNYLEGACLIPFNCLVALPGLQWVLDRDLQFIHSWRGILVVQYDIEHIGANVLLIYCICSDVFSCEFDEFWHWAVVS